MGTDRSDTLLLVEALRRHGVSVRSVEQRSEIGDDDLLYLEGDDYLAVDYDDAERIGVVGVSWNTSMPFGGNPTHQLWQVPDVSLDDIAEAMAASLDELRR